MHVLNRGRCGAGDAGRHRARPRAARAAAAGARRRRRRRARGPCPARPTTSTPRASSGSRPAAPPTRARRSSPPGPPRSRPAGWSATRAPPPTRSAPRWPEVVATDHVADAARVQAWAVGPGLGTGDDGRGTLAHVLDAGVPVLADADAITLLGASADLRAAAAGNPVLVTPHAGEFARLVAELDGEFDPAADRVDAARRAAAALGVTVLLKGNATVVAAPDGRVLVHPAGSSWLATAGSGDVLSGVAGALLAAGLEPWWAGGCAAFVHARAAAIGARARAGDGRAGTRTARRARPCPPRGCRRADGGDPRAVRAAAAGRAVSPPAPRPGPRRSSTSTRSATTSRPSPRLAAGAAMMAVVKADGYGHGAVAVARAALDARRDLARRLHRRRGRRAARRRDHRARAVLAARARRRPRARPWPPTSTSASPPGATSPPPSPRARATGRPARVHLKIDTGLRRNGCPPARLGRPARPPSPTDAAARSSRSRSGPTSRTPTPPPTRRSTARPPGFDEAARGRAAPSSAARCSPTSRTRRPPSPAPTCTATSSGPGSRSTGSTPPTRPSPPALRPAMTFRSRVALVKRVAAGEGVSYGHEWTTPADRTLALVPAGLRRRRPAPARATGRMPVLIAGVRRPVVGRVCMDQVMVDLGRRSARRRRGRRGGAVRSRRRRSHRRRVGRPARHDPLRDRHRRRRPAPGRRTVTGSPGTPP